MQFENIAIKAKLGVLAAEDNDKCTNLKRWRYWNKGCCSLGTSKCPYTTVQTIVSGISRRGAALAKDVN